MTRHIARQARPDDPSAGGDQSSAKRLRSIGQGVLAIGALLALPIGLASSAAAEIIQLAGPAFVHHGPSEEAEVQNGVLITNGQNVQYFASVQLPDAGQKVCRFSLVYKDVNQQDDMTARLLRKKYSVGGNAMNTPIVMASVKSSGNQDGVRIASTSDIKNPTPDEDNSFYYVQLDVVTANLEVLGVRIETGNTCSN